METHRYPLFAPGDIQDIPGITHTDIVLYANIYGLTQSTGYCWASNEYLQGRMKISERTLQRALQRLQNEGLISIEQTLGSRKIYMVAYQTKASELTTPPSQVTPPPVTGDAPPPPLSSNNKKRVINYYDQILELYKNYPRKMGKSIGLKKLVKEIKSDEDLEQLSGAIRNYTNHCIRNKVEEQYIKHFSTFAACWQDWVEQTNASSQPQKEWVKYNLVDGQLVAVAQE
jgi:hypothetical protein